MVDMIDKKLYYSMSFNEQMAWIGAEIEQILKYNDTHNIKEEIKKQGKNSYGAAGDTHVINRLFEIIKADPKNKALLREVNKAEEEWKAFLYDEPWALSGEQMFTYWNSYLQSYIAELETHAIHYILVKGIKESNCEEIKSEVFLGVYDSIARLQDAYVIALQKLEECHKSISGLLGDNAEYIVKHEKVMINVFDESIACWYYDVSPERLFW